MGDRVTHLRRVGIRLVCRVTVGLSAWILLTAQAGMAIPATQPLQQVLPPAALHKQALEDYNHAARCGPVALRDALSAHHVMPDVRGCAFQAVRGYFPEFGGHAVARQDEASSLAVGLIARSVPNPDTALATGQSVTLYVSSGTPPLVPAMPGVVGHTETDARGTLNQVGLRNVTSQPGPSERPKGVVYEQTPEPGRTVSTGTPVFLGISQGPPIDVIGIVVPDVVGRPAGSAEAAIRARQLQPVSGGREDGARLRGEVTRTIPPANTATDRGTKVRYWTASGFNEVPDLYLLSPEDARIRLQEAGFRPGRVDEQNTSENVGRILAQQPMAGIRAAVGTAVATSVGVAQSSNQPTSIATAVLGGLLVLGGGWWLRRTLRIARTRRLLKLKPSCGPGDAMRFTVTPAFTLCPRLEDGETRFRDGLPVLHVEIHHE